MFSQADTVEGPNRYSYVGGNPILFSDPSGHQSTYCDVRLNGTAMANDPFLMAYCMVVDPIIHVDEGGNAELSENSEAIIDMAVQIVPYTIANYLGGSGLAESVDMAICGLSGNTGVCMAAAQAAGPNLSYSIADDIFEDTIKVYRGTGGGGQLIIKLREVCVLADLL